MAETTCWTGSWFYRLKVLSFSYVSLSFEKPRFNLGWKLNPKPEHYQSWTEETTSLCFVWFCVYYLGSSCPFRCSFFIWDLEIESVNSWIKHKHTCRLYSGTRACHAAVICAICILTSRQAAQIALSSQVSKPTRSSIQCWPWKITRPTLSSAQWRLTMYIPIACQLPLIDHMCSLPVNLDSLNLHISQALPLWVDGSLQASVWGGEQATVFELQRLSAQERH